MEHILKKLGFDAVPSIQDVVFNLQGILGFFMSKDMKKSGQTVYWAEQLLKNQEESDDIANIFALMEAIDVQAITPQVKVQIYSDKSGEVVIANKDFTERKEFASPQECCEILRQWV